MANRTQLTLATCNLYNLNLPGKPMYRDSEGWTEAQYAAKLKWLSNAITTIDADCWGFQELWHKEALEAVFTEAGILEQYHLLVPEDHTGGRIVCAAAVRKEHLVGEPEWFKDFPEKMILRSGGDDDQTPDIGISIHGFSRPVLHFRIRPRSNGKTISVFVAHLKSKRPTTLYREGWYREDSDYYKKHAEGMGYAISTIRRTAEATAMRMMLTDVMKDTDTPVVVLGDLNDGQHSNTLNIISGQPNYILSGLSQGGSDVDLYEVGALQAYRSLRDVYYTHIFQNQKESLDHIFVSQEFYDNSRKRIWAFKEMAILNDHLNHDNHSEDGSPDHGIVSATFEYRPYRKS